MSALLNSETQNPAAFNSRGLLKNEYALRLPSQSRHWRQSRHDCREKWLHWIFKSALIFVGVLSLLFKPFGVAAFPSAGVSSNMRLILHKRVQAHGGSSSWSENNFEQTFALSKSAIVVTDMWDKHWCRGATERVGIIALRMEPLLERARASGILIIHAPSETMSFYAGSEGRKLAQ